MNDQPLKSHMHDLSVILKSAKLGDPDAESELHRAFVDRLIRLASSRINARFRAKIEPEEVVQSVFITFFKRNSNDEFHFDNWNDLWALLVKITVRKCANKVEGFMAAKRDVKRELEGKVNNSRDSSINASCGEPTVEEVAVFNEMLDQLLDNLSELQREVVVLRLQGFSNLEISEKLGTSERTVYRALDTVRKTFTKLDN